MSANNWTTCPECKKSAQHTKGELGKRLPMAYGGVTQDEYRKLLTEFETPILLGDTLREDYELGIRDGEFYVNYSAHCNECGFSFEFKHALNRVHG